MLKLILISILFQSGYAFALNAETLNESTGLLPNSIYPALVAVSDDRGSDLHDCFMIGRASEAISEAALSLEESANTREARNQISEARLYNIRKIISSFHQLSGTLREKCSGNSVNRNDVKVVLVNVLRANYFLTSMVISISPDKKATLTEFEELNSDEQQRISEPLRNTSELGTSANELKWVYRIE